VLPSDRHTRCNRHGKFGKVWTCARSLYNLLCRPMSYVHLRCRYCTVQVVWHMLVPASVARVKKQRKATEETSCSRECISRVTSVFPSKHRSDMMNAARLTVTIYTRHSRLYIKASIHDCQQMTHCSLFADMLLTRDATTSMD